MKGRVDIEGCVDKSIVGDVCVFIFCRIKKGEGQGKESVTL